ncbi:bacillithiol biosynthesis cysteine-adding enzyme BshC [Mucilaginibacter arboris]|uniref:Putative cysteine ligase BshC n=1 Tax=Mucilaginibacter arboris TaxID=2682090 RepID=A0A7K1SXR7_9SPHI|nr:bacillithiol biosynthesis cysteine-adding enzyme BshC [Mucilaginibacter arboris]MVN22119.1 bacillithiol biosynthesis cysteine-adding enzyme BshC [Mucilaginibacter arboris]
MDATYIDYQSTNSFSPTVILYLKNDAALKPFYSYCPDFDGFRQLLQHKKNTCKRSILTEALNAQYEKLPVKEVSELTLNNLSLLKQENTFTVTTGHQLNIFTGPLYFIFKIVTAINLAKDLKSEFPDKNFVPVYWMASEDHDFAEINHTQIGGKKVAWNEEVSGATGRILTKGIREALNQYKGVLGIENHAEELSKLVETAYTKFEKLADATRYLVNSLFSKFGLVILDADDSRLKQEFAPIIEEDIINQNSFKNISATNKKLEELGIHIQVNPREINFFYLLNEVRERIVFEDNQYKVLNTETAFSEEELKAEIASFPERFSPNVVMRPLYQEVILPNIAYIGGGAEVVYWLELKANFEFYGIDFPILILRNSGLIVSKRAVEKVEKMGLTLPDFFQGTDILKTDWIKANSQNQLQLKQEWQELSQVFERMKLQNSKIDPTLVPSTEAIQKRLEHAVFNLEKKLVKAEKRNYETRLNQIDQVKNELFPGGNLQERNENFGLFYVKQGPELINQLVKHFKPLDFKFTILTE